MMINVTMVFVFLQLRLVLFPLSLLLEILIFAIFTLVILQLDFTIIQTEFAMYHLIFVFIIGVEKTTAYVPQPKNTTIMETSLILIIKNGFHKETLPALMPLVI